MTSLLSCIIFRCNRLPPTCLPIVFTNDSDLIRLLRGHSNTQQSDPSTVMCNERDRCGKLSVPSPWRSASHRLHKAIVHTQKKWPGVCQVYHEMKPGLRGLGDPMREVTCAQPQSCSSAGPPLPPSLLHTSVNTSQGFKHRSQ